MTPQEKLRRAAALVQEAMSAVPDHRHECQCCGRTVYDSWEAHQLHEALEPLPGKLRRIASREAAFEGTTVVPLERRA